MRPAVLRSPLATLVWAWLLLGTLPAFAQEAAAPKAAEPKAAAQAPSWAYIFVATGPLERVEAAFAQMGVPLPRPLDHEALERDFAFIGPGGMRARGSLGMLMGPGVPGSTEPSGVLLFPVNKDVAPLKDFAAMGGRVLPESTSTAGARPIPPPSIRSSRRTSPSPTRTAAMSTHSGGAWARGSTSGC
jgi:hypothetical protein